MKKIKKDWTPGMWTSQQEAKAYAKGYRAGLKRRDSIAENRLFEIRDICLNLIARQNDTSPKNWGAGKSNKST